ncbi:collagenase [Streptomyces sp. NPDC020096]
MICTRPRRALGRTAASLTAAVIALCLGTGPALAAAAPSHGAWTVGSPPTHETRTSASPAPTGASAAGTDAGAVQHGRLSPGRIPPPRPIATRGSAQSPPVQPATQSCTPAAFSSRTGGALASYIESSTTDCINTLFSITGSDAHGVFPESQMIPVAQAFQSLSKGYSGDNSAGIWQLVIYLRAGYYVQYNDSADVGSYDAQLTTAVVGGLNAFFAAAHSKDVSTANGNVLGDAVILTDSANVQQYYLSTYKRILGAYNSSWDAYHAMDGVVYDVYTPLWRGQWNPAFVTAITNDSSIITALDTFALNHTGLLGGDNTFLDADAAQDLAIYVQFPALQATVRPLMLGLLHASHISGTTAALWVAVAEQSNAYDIANCSYYGTCNLTAQLTAAALPTTYHCNSEITILAQSLSPADLAAACSNLAGQDSYFQGVVKDRGPIPNQYNTTDNVVVFSSRLNYVIYAGAIYGVPTNNGGITLYGDPSAPANQDYSILYQDPSPDGYTDNIWNLNYEYTHFLDARYDTKGTWTQIESEPNIWWVEGISGYISYSYRGIVDTEAVADAGRHTYPLSTLWQTTYANSNDDRVFPWGYLAVRYMLEEHPADVQTILTYFRNGDYTGAYNYYTNTIGSRYDPDFNSWLNALAGIGTLPTCTDPNTQAMGQNCSRGNQSATAGNLDYLFIWLPSGTTTLTVTTNGGTGSTSLYYDPDTWATPSTYTASSTNSGTAQRITVSNTTAGYRYISLYAVTDFSGVTVTTRY